MMRENMDPNWIGESEEDEIYKENIIDHYKNPRNFGTLNQFTLKHKESNPVCGDEIEIFIKLNKDNVDNVKFTGKGCALSIAATSILTEHIKNKNIRVIKDIKKDEILDILGIKLGVVRMRCGLLCLKTLLKGIERNHNSFKED